MPKIDIPTEFQHKEKLYLNGFRDGSNQVNVYGQHPDPAYAAGHRAGTAYREKEEAGESVCSRCAELEARCNELELKLAEAQASKGWFWPTQKAFAAFQKSLDDLDKLIDNCKQEEEPPLELLENPAWR